MALIQQDVALARRSLSGHGLVMAICLVLCGFPKCLPAQELVGQENSAAPSQTSYPAMVRGIITDTDGAAVQGAQIALSKTGSPERKATTGADGSFTLEGLSAGDYLLVVTASGLAAESEPVTVHPGEVLDLPAIALHAAANIDVEVSYTKEELAEQDVKAEEKQKVFGIVPNFFVVYQPHPPSLNARQKFELAFHGIRDPSAFAITGFVAGVEQAMNTFPGYHQGLEGYGKRFGATYANTASATLLRDATFPALFHQDPRYFYKGTGTVWERTKYALSTAVICKGDNGRWQPNYSSLLGNMSAGALANLYYPASSRNGAALTIENGLLSTVGVGVGHVIQEFVFSHITSKHAREPMPQPAASAPPASTAKP